MGWLMLQAWCRSAQLYSLAIGADTLSAHLIGLATMGVALDGHGSPRRDCGFRKATVLHTKRGRQHRNPSLALGLQSYIAMGMLISAFHDLAGELETLVRIVLGPAVVGIHLWGDRQHG